MMTAVASEVRCAVGRQCGPGTEYGAVVRDLCDRMNRGAYDPDYLSQVVQRRGNRFSLGDAYVFTLFLGDFWTGKLAVARIRATAAPRTSADAGGPAAPALAWVPEPFYVPPREGSGCETARLGWREPVVMTRAFDRSRTGEGVRHESVEVEPGAVPLVVGFATAARTRTHHYFDGGLARWPAGSGWVTVCLRVVPDGDGRRVHFRSGPPPQSPRLLRGPGGPGFSAD